MDPGSSLKDAIRVLEPGGLLLLGEGRWRENLRILKDLMLEGSLDEADTLVSTIEGEIYIGPNLSVELGNLLVCGTIRIDASSEARLRNVTGIDLFVHKRAIALLEGSTFANIYEFEEAF